MGYNEIYSIIDVTDDSGDYEEPVSIDEMKDYLRLEGYIDDDESTSDDLSDFDFDDMLIADMIRAAREQIEKISASTIIHKTWQAVINNYRKLELPRGPIQSIVSLEDVDGVAITDYTTIGVFGDRIFLKSPNQCEMTITYTAGYDVVPASLKIDIMRLVSYMYENRGDDASIQKFASALSGKYRREGWIV